MFVYFVLYHVPSCIPFTKKRFSQILTHSHIIDIDTRYQHCILLIYVRTCIVGSLGLCFFCNFASDRNFGLSFIDFGKSCVWSMFIWFFLKKNNWCVSIYGQKSLNSLIIIVVLSACFTCNNTILCVHWKVKWW